MTNFSKWPSVPSVIRDLRELKGRPQHSLSPRGRALTPTRRTWAGVFLSSAHIWLIRPQTRTGILLIIPQTEHLNQQTFLSHSSKSWKTQIKVLVDSVSGKALLPGS